MTDDTCKKYQWSKFESPAKLEQFVIRTDDENEMWAFRDSVLKRVPGEHPFPNDTGSVAHSTGNGVPPAPMCGVHHIAMTLKPAGVSRTGKKYPAFWSCSERNTDGSFCTFRPK